MTETRVMVRSPNVKVADEIWVATALLHREFPSQPDFAVDAVVERVRREGLSDKFRPSVYVNVIQHCVANRPPAPGRYRVLFETAPGRRRLFRPGDSYDLRREGSKTVPLAEELPKGYESLLGWYKDWVQNPGTSVLMEDPLMRMARIGKHVWQDEDPDEYVKRLREGWE